MRKLKNRQVFDPVADWDGMIGVAINGRTVLWTPEQLVENSRRTLEAMERSTRAKREDEAERCPPRRRARLEWWK